MSKYKNPFGLTDGVIDAVMQVVLGEAKKDDEKDKKAKKEDDSDDREDQEKASDSEGEDEGDDDDDEGDDEEDDDDDEEDSDDDEDDDEEDSDDDKEDGKKLKSKSSGKDKVDIDPEERNLNQEEFKVGDNVHMGFGTKGGAGYRGVVHKIDGDTVYVRSHEKTNGGILKGTHKVWKGHKRLVTKESAIWTSDGEHGKNASGKETVKIDGQTYLVVKKSKHGNREEWALQKPKGKKTYHAVKYENGGFSSVV